MRIAFRAVQGSFEDDGETLVAGVATGDDCFDDEGSYITFQRGADSARSLEDWEEDGLYFEYKDQLYGGYGLVDACRLGRDRLAIDLATPMSELENVVGFDVELAINDESYESLRDGLLRIIEGTRARLMVE
ncbi:Imm10 family immunity protein [Paludisphaera mucosa]|uniref:Imm10 family immunity protein n=1 Tax=Paludisphaera mucosa TaxID=3030827 RepID=A0ABT6FL08_9BACT|nr:Imm10 family immunity protein [Paludisphaera mucosa]MDG3008240.1 Imm10 family immunity protein [Paludisphaera mucosa]